MVIENPTPEPGEPARKPDVPSFDYPAPPKAPDKPEDDHGDKPRPTS